MTKSKSGCKRSKADLTKEVCTWARLDRRVPRITVRSRWDESAREVGIPPAEEMVTSGRSVVGLGWSGGYSPGRHGRIAEGDVASLDDGGGR